MFKKGRPVWAEGREKELNLHLEFFLDVPQGGTLLRITASTAYQLFADGALIAYGPARAGDGCFRVDEWDIRGRKRLRVLVAGYYASSFQYCLYPSFLCCEVTGADGKVLFASSPETLTVREYAPRLRYTDKYARQRLFTEVMDFTRPAGKTVKLTFLPAPGYLPRRIAPFSGRVFTPVRAVSDFTVKRDTEAEKQRSPFSRGMKFYNPVHDRCFENQECDLYAETMRLRFAPVEARETDVLSAGEARLYAFDRDRAGLIGMTVTADGESEIYLIFDEILTDGDVPPRRSNCLNALKFILPAGKREVLSFEPYTLRYLKVCVTKGKISGEPFLIEQAGADIAPLTFKDPQVQSIWDAAVNTFRQNATDIYMDCPSRERAGWLCDSFFTGRSEYALTGKSTVETNFLENFAVNDGFRKAESMPDGMLPMLYPGSSDYIGEWIANWALWGVIECAEYALLRGGDKELTEKLKPMAAGVLNAFKQYENADGLIEDLGGWVFVEWSRANDKDVVCGVNWPTNMLYSGACEAAGRLCGDEALVRKAERLRSLIRENAYNGRLFADNSIRENGALVRTNNTTEVCQYYALFFGIAGEKTHPDLVKIITDSFGPLRKQNNAYPDVPFANSFIGNYLRLDCLMKLGRYEQVLSEIKLYFGFMAEKSGSLWEYDTPQASCCHGFASYAAVWLKELKGKLNL